MQKEKKKKKVFKSVCKNPYWTRPMYKPTGVLKIYQEIGIDITDKYK